jgi:hypothetical protein
MGTGGPFPGGKARPGRDADHSPPSSAKVVPPWRVEGLLYCFTSKKTLLFAISLLMLLKEIICIDTQYKITFYWLLK